MLSKRLIKSNDAGGGCTNTVDLYNPFSDGGGVALYQLNGDATDVSGNYDGAANDVTYGAGEFGQAGVFNGSSSYISTGINYTALSEVTYSAWVLINNAVANNIILGGINGSYGNQGMLSINPTLSRFDYVSSDNNYRRHALSVSNGWHNFVVTDDKLGNVNMYIDGVDVSYAIPTTGSYTQNTNIQIGRSMRNTGAIGNYNNGSLDQVRIFSRALRPYEVEALYTEEYCTPTIVPSEHFNTVLWTGNEVSGRQITGVGFQPDFVWIKDRGDGTHWHNLFDSVRGASERLFSNTTNAESFYNESLQSFNSDGFTVGFDPDVNRSGGAIVGWSWKAGGAAVTNTDGTTTSQVSANLEAGFSVVTHGGPTGEFSVGHGLGTMPSIVITKGRLAAGDWTVYFTFLDGSLDFMRLNQTSAKENSSRTMWTDEVFYTTTENAVAYCFAEVEGFSSFGSYVGNGSSNGPTVVTGFEPAFLMIKNSSAIYEWVIVDNKRTIDNPRNKELNPNSSAAENATGDPTSINFLENGFQIVSTDGATNQNNGKLIYMAFAADPTTVEPTLEDSFNTVLYSGNNSTNPITGVGFQPDLIWIKNRDNANNHFLTDSIRGAGKYLIPDTTGAEDTTARFNSIDSDGFTVSTDTALLNNSSYDYVAWNWKGAELPAINSNGSITSVVSANPAAGFSIVSYTGNGANATIGHGLSDAPDMIIVKRRNASGSWNVYHSALGNNSTLILQLTIAELIGAGTWGTTNPTSSVFTIGTGINDTNNYIAYCFAEVAGFSKFGSYVGNGSNQYINLGFEPAFIMVKRTDNTGTWGMFDNKRGLSAPQPRLLANDSAAENTGTTYWASTDSTGFTVQGSSIYGTGNFIYMAFANQF